jgi:hypothetical protein
LKGCDDNARASTPDCTRRCPTEAGTERATEGIICYSAADVRGLPAAEGVVRDTAAEGLNRAGE